ncbi:MAG TPA: hypothetical protein VLR89_10510 [Anaerolineaceae bacterium]|nr:hypothetical protein [Anaerolineaceae bacterium]
MNQTGAEPQNSKDSSSSWRKIPLWLRLFLICLLFLVLISFGIIIYLLGRTGDYKGYTGQIIDTIIISPRSDPSGTPEASLPLKLWGNFGYPDSRQYRLELVDEYGNILEYSLSTLDGYFDFNILPPGSYSLRVYAGDELIASCNLIIQREALISTPQLVRTDENTYLLLVPTDLPAVQLYISIQNGTIGTPPGKQILIELGPKKVEPVQPTPTPTVPTSTQPVPVIINPTVQPSAPKVIVRDNTTSGQIWTSLTAVDLFAERAGNFGVQTILGKNVIAPGSYGAYGFYVYNPESYSIEYILRLSETDGNTPKLPMLYRLKRGTGGSDYIGGSAWKNAQNITLDWTTISPKATAPYTLEWKWDPSNNPLDTAIGTQNSTPSYVLVISITAQEH